MGVEMAVVDEHGWNLKTRGSVPDLNLDPCINFFWAPCGSFAELFVDMSVLPSLLPSKRDASQTKNALDMLLHCFRHPSSLSLCLFLHLVLYPCKNCTM